MVAGCDQTENITFRTQVHEAIVDCDGSISIDHLAVYLHDFEILVDGSWRRADVNDERNRDVALLEFTTCEEGGARKAVPIRSARMGSAQGLAFSVSVPDDLNHLQPTLASYPLNRTDMYWSWQQGYKFLSLEGRTNDAPLVLHLGSTGCKSPAPVRPPAEPCSRPNRITFRHPDFSLDSHEIVIDLSEIVSLLAGTRCTGNYTQSEVCTAVLDILGIDAETGRCGPDCGQRVFKVVPRP